MTTQTVFDRVGFPLFETFDRSPTEKYVRPYAGGSDGGCSICVTVISFPRSLRLSLGRDIEPPADLEIMVLTGEEGEARRFAPKEDAIAYLLKVGSVDLYLPAGAATSSPLTVQFAFIASDGDGLWGATPVPSW